MTNITTNPSTTSHLFANIRATVVQFFETAQQNKMYRTTVKELSNLSTRELDDLGISRSEIHSIARRSVFGN